jgi:putative tryptophan/tyrosine transport system substrate-binding protein
MISPLSCEGLTRASILSRRMMDFRVKPGNDDRQTQYLRRPIRRREFIALLGSAAAAWPLSARAQQPAMPVVGFLNTASPAQYAHRVGAFRNGLSEAGFIEGRNVAIEYRWADGQNDRLPTMAADLVRHQVTVICTNGPATLVAKAATAAIPIVFTTAVNPVAAGAVASLNRPGGNLTGVTTLATELGPKRLEVLHELVPTTGIIPVLLDPNGNNAEIQLRDLQGAARDLGLQLHFLHASTESDFDTAFATLLQMRADALMIGTSAFFNSRSEQLAALSIRHRLPTIFYTREFAVAGGLMSYGSSFADAYRLAGIYTGRILKGAKPADLPVQQSTKVELVINLKTAKALGVTFPLTLLGRADEVIE